MKCKFSISMYSGSMPPECELTQEQIEHINELVSKLDTPYQHIGPFQLWGLNSLSSDSYMVFWMDERCIGNPDFMLCQNQKNEKKKKIMTFRLAFL